MSTGINDQTGLTDEQVLAGIVLYHTQPRPQSEPGIHPNSRTAAAHHIDPRTIAFMVPEPCFAVGALRCMGDEKRIKFDRICERLAKRA